jgi:uncharacterized membrane protein YraQ (UPF0718 family)
MTAIIINATALIMLVFIMRRDKTRAVKALKTALKMGISLLPMLLIIIISIGMLFAFVPEETLQRFLGEQSGIFGVLATAAAGAILHIPALLAFPLSASLLEKGASLAVVAAFITTLTMVGFVTLPLEIKELGARFALWRNGLSLVAAVGIALIMGAIL